jgi:hypothetical protein
MIAAALLALAVGPAASASAEAPAVAITSPADGSSTNNQSPLFGGTLAEKPEEIELAMQHTVTVKLFRGGVEVEPALKATFTGTTWSVPSGGVLPPGIYTAEAEIGELPEVSKSPPVTFTVDNTPPQVSITSPANGSSSSNPTQVVSGTAETESVDLPAVTITLYAGPAVQPGPGLESVGVQAVNGTWTATFGGLALGTYTARAEQSDGAGNTGASAPLSFTISPPPRPPTHPPPVASFTWFPTAPEVGESVSFVSSSTDHASPITGFAWALGSRGVFHAGGPVLATTFAEAGPHVVSLRVTAADGLSSTVTQTIPVAAPLLTPMLPFPIVRIAGRLGRYGATLSLLAARVPTGSLVTVSCRGRGCPSKLQSGIAAARPGVLQPSTVQLVFRRFERFLRAGVVLEIRVAQSGQIGKYTRLVIRRNRLPLRVDSCLEALAPAPVTCPSS